MSRLTRALLLHVVVLPVLALTAGATLGADEAKPYVDRTSIQITTIRQIVWVDPPKGQGDEQWAVWKWVPRVNFSVLGPLPGGSAVFVQFSRPDGKPWLKLDYTTPELAAGQCANFEGNPSAPEGNACGETGVFPFKIGYKSGLDNTEATLFSGKVKMNRFLCAEVNAARFGKQFIYYADQDWNLPIGYLYCPQVIRRPGGTTDYEFESPLNCQMWFAHDTSTDPAVSALLFCNGKQIACTDKEGEGSVLEDVVNLAPESGEKCCFVRYTIEFARALVWDKQPEAHPDAEWFHIEKSPGDYEIRVLVNKQLARDARFAVGADGKIVDNGLAQKGNVGTWKMLLPVKATGTEGRKWNPAAYKTQAFWFNPVEGFEAPQ